MNELADCCPECVNGTAATPRRVEATADGVRADYCCGECGHEWFTCWNGDVLASGSAA